MTVQLQDSNKENYKLVQKLSNLEWKENQAYLQKEKQVWFSEGGRLYIRDTTNTDVEYNQELMYLEDRFNPERLATDEKVNKLVERILGKSN